MSTVVATAYFVVLALDPPTQYGPPGAAMPAWSYKGHGTAMFGYLMASDEIDTPEKAARQFLKETMEHGLLPIDTTVLPTASVGIICDSVQVTFEPTEAPVGLVAEFPFFWLLIVVLVILAIIWFAKRI